MNVLVLGGTRLTGPFIVRSLVEQGHPVTAFHRGQTQADLPPGVHRITGERRALADFAGEFKRLAPDVVLDMLAFTREDANMLMHSFKGVARRVVVPSSIDPGGLTRRRSFEPSTLAPDDHGDLVVGVVAMPQYTSPQPYRFVVRGSPDNGDDVPVPGSTVTLETTLVSAVDAAASDLPAAEFSTGGQVGTDGRVELMLIPPEPGMVTRTYTLRVHPPAGSAFATVEDAAFSLDNTTGRAQVLRLPSKVRLSGAVRAGDGKPVENAVVEAVPTQDGTLSLAAMSDGVAATATTDAAGKYVLRVDRGRFDVRVKPPQGSPYPRESQEGVMITEGLDLPLDLPLGGKAAGNLALDNGSTFPMVEIRFYLAAEDGKSAARLRGVAQTSETGAFDVVLP